MHEALYGLRRDPFRLTPDRAFRYRHRSYRKAEAYIEYGLERGEGLVMVTSAPGLGKTTLITGALADADRSEIAVSTVVSTRLAASDLLDLVAMRLGIDADGVGKGVLLAGIERHLAAAMRQNRRTVLFVDEAQSLHRGAIEELRLLTNLQDHGAPLLQVFLAGHENLRDLVRDPAFEHLRQRLIATCHLEPLEPSETAAYIEHRLTVAGWDGVPAISTDALDLVHRASAGVPRRVNHLMSRMLLEGAIESRRHLGKREATLAVEELREEGLLSSETSAERVGEGQPADPARVTPAPTSTSPARPTATGSTARASASAGSDPGALPPPVLRRDQRPRAARWPKVAMLAAVVAMSVILLTSDRRPATIAIARGIATWAGERLRAIPVPEGLRELAPADAEASTTDDLDSRR